jgi:hypothetical protein
MATADHDHIERFSGGTGEAHGFIIRMFWVSRSSLVEWPSPLSPSAGVTRYVFSRSNRYGFC